MDTKPPTIFYIYPDVRASSIDDFQLLHQKRYREQYIVQRSREDGYKAELFYLSYDAKPWQADNASCTWVLPVRFDKRLSPWGPVSTVFLNRVEEDKPDLIVFKGLKDYFSHWLMCKASYAFRFAFIVGGSTWNTLTPYADYILAEHEGQVEKSFLEQVSQQRVSLYSKLNYHTHTISNVEKVFDIINIGHFIELKQQNILLPFAEKYNIALIGNGPTYQDIKKRADAYGSRVYMPGNVSRDQIPVLISQSRLMVHPAKREGFARVILEAFACGVPVVASKRAMPGVFEHGVQGLLVEPEEIIPAAKELLEDDERLREMGRNALEYVKTYCSEDAVYSAVKAMYDRVFSTPPLCRGATRWTLRRRLEYSALRRGFSQNLTRLKRKMRDSRILSSASF